MPRPPVRLGDGDGFPNPRNAVCGGPCDGLVAIGGDLSLDRMRDAYRHGLFPWTATPVTWWSPDPRGIIELGNLHVSRSLRRRLRKAPYRVTVDQTFEGVIRACASVRRPGGWIVPEFVRAYTAAHRAGWAHSVECWSGDDLVGGVYGVVVGGLFAGESMFHRADDASKIALVHLHERLVEKGFRLFDIQMVTDTTSAMGAIEVSRETYLSRLREVVDMPIEF